MTFISRRVNFVAWSGIIVYQEPFFLRKTPKETLITSFDLISRTCPTPIPTPPLPPSLAKIKLKSCQRPHFFPFFLSGATTYPQNFIQKAPPPFRCIRRDTDLHSLLYIYFLIFLKTTRSATYFS